MFSSPIKKTPFRESKELIPFLEILEKINVKKDDFDENHPFYKPLEKCYKIVFPDEHSFDNEENQKKWTDFIYFMNGCDFTFIKFLLENIDKNLKSNAESLGRLIFLIQKMGFKPIDFYKKLTIRLESDYIDDLGTFNFSLDELPLPQELLPFNKKRDFIGVNSDCFNQIINLSCLFNKNAENKKTIELMIFLIDKNFFDFSIFTKKIFLSHIKEKEFVDEFGNFRCSCEETQEEIDFEKFKEWLNDWKNECGVTEKEDGSGFEIQEPLTEKQKAIQHLVRHGFSEEYTKKAFAQYAINKNPNIFIDGRVDLDDSRIPNNLLVDFIDALPKESTFIVFYHVLSDDDFSHVIDALKNFPGLKKIFIKQQDLSDVKKIKLREIFNSQTNPELKLIRYLPDKKNRNDAKYLEDIDFFKTLNISISADIPEDLNNANKKEAKEKELFDYHQELVKHEKIILNTKWTEFFIPSGIVRVFNYLSNEPAISKITEISGDISKLNVQQFEKFLNILCKLTNLKTLHLTYSDKCQNPQGKEEKIKSIISLSKVEFTWSEKETKEYEKPQPLPNETLETALLTIEQELNKNSEKVSTDDNKPIYPSEENIDVSEHSTFNESTDRVQKSLGICSQEEINLFKEKLLKTLNEKNNAIGMYIQHFFNTFIDALLEERDRFIKILGETLHPSLFSVSTEKDIYLLCQKIDALSGFLDDLGEVFNQFMDKNPEELNEVTTVFLRKLTLLTNFSADNAPTIASNSEYRIGQVIASSRFKVEENLNVSVINQARSEIGMYLKQLVTRFFMTLPSIPLPWSVKKETDKKTDKKTADYRDGFFTDSAKHLSKVASACEKETKALAENQKNKFSLPITDGVLSISSSCH